MQRSICIPVFSPSISPRRGRGVRLKLPNIAWAAALIAVGLAPASVIAEGETPTMTITPHNASGILGIGAGKNAHSKAGHDLRALGREYQAYLQRADAQARTVRVPIARRYRPYLRRLRGHRRRGRG